MTISDHCTARRDGGKLIIEIPESELLALARKSSDTGIKIENEEAFLAGIAKEVRHMLHPEGNYQTCLDFTLERAVFGAASEGHGASLIDPLSAPDGDVLSSTPDGVDPRFNAGT
jgi:hypothetical protein